jgi:hypothetical protein
MTIAGYSDKEEEKMVMSREGCAEARPIVACMMNYLAPNDRVLQVL